MSVDRRSFLRGVAAAGTGALLPSGLDAPDPATPSSPSTTPSRAAGLGHTAMHAQAMPDRFDPWIEVDREALAHNVAVVSRLTGGRPILAVVKNNAYGLGLETAAGLLSENDSIRGFAVVKPEDAIALRDAGIEQEILLMGMAPDGAVRDLVEAGVRLSLYLDDDARRLPQRVPGDRPIAAHVYLDTGLSRMGMPYHRSLPWMAGLAESNAFDIVGTFMAFTEEPDFDPEQLGRFRSAVDAARARGVDLGRLHAASSNGVFHLPEAHLDMVRPGIALFGGYPSRPDEERSIAVLRPAVSLRCRVVRVERLRPGDGVSYGRSYVAERPTWIATLPAGHVDAYPRTAVEGARVAIGGASYPVIGAVSASHTIVEIGEVSAVEVGEVATLLGGDEPDVYPNEVARASGSSVYDLFMHLDPKLPRFVV